jgi:predicted metal-dependent HD superfamily phosphohydrolase
MADLEIHWVEFWKKGRERRDSLPVFRDLTNRYIQQHRYYHNQLYLERCLEEFERTKHLCSEHYGEVSVELAVWCHKAFYDTRKNDNEERSAEYAEFLGEKMALSRGVIRHAQDLIVLMRFDDLYIDPDAQLLSDINLSILGQSSELFDRYEEGLRNEHFWLSDEAFKEMLKRRIHALTSKPSIYSTQTFKSRYERNAERNFVRSLKRLNIKI